MIFFKLLAIFVKLFYSKSKKNKINPNLPPTIDLKFVKLLNCIVKLTSRTRLPLPTNIDLEKQVADSKVDALCNVALSGIL